MKKTALFLLCLLLLFTLLAGCGKSSSPAAEPAVSEPEESPAAEAPVPEAAPEEYRLTAPELQSDFVCEDNARVFYEIFVGSFSDSNGDGVGDLRGIIDRMDYLNDGDPDSGLSLGIEGIWLTPVFPSPSYHKYDVADYYSIDSKLGTLEDMKELLSLCHERNVKVILDMPINHTSIRNDWFQRFVVAHRQNDPANEYYDYYSWCTVDSQIPGSTYRPIPDTDQFYECNFSDDMPELNFDLEAVRQQMLDVAKFWMDLGVDGFRFDAAKYIYFNDNGRSADFWLWYLNELRTENPDLYTVAEVWDADSVIDQYIGSTNCFNFTLSQAEGLVASAIKGSRVDALISYEEEYIGRIRSINPEAMIVPFITNHDQDRAAGFLKTDEGQMQMAANLYLLGPGSPFIYYGEELGMRGSRGGANTDANRRLAMVWNDGDTVQDPEGSTYKKQIEAGVAEQITDKNSLYTYYKQLLMIRHANPEIARGDYTAVSFSGNRLGGFTSEWNGSTVCVLHNATDAEITVDLAKAGLDLSVLRAVAGMNEATLEGTVLTVGAMTSVVLK